jgi:hypothetical protein
VPCTLEATFQPTPQAPSPELCLDGFVI